MEKKEFLYFSKRGVDQVKIKFENLIGEGSLP